jgi:hypothetical protein
MKTTARYLSTASFLWLVLIFTVTSPARAQKTSETPCCRSSLEVSSSRSVQLLMNAPNGFETGYDPANYGTLVNQIPSSNYSLGFSGNGSSGVERKLEIGTPAAGRYVLQAIGASSGNFTLKLKATDERGAIVTRRFRGATRPGRTFVYFVQYSPTPGAKFTVTPLTPFSEFSANVIVVPDMPPSFRVSASIGVSPSSSFDPVAQPLTFQLGNYAVTIPPGSFIRKDQGNYDYDGSIEGITLDAQVLPEAGNKFSFKLKVQGINLSEAINPVRILLILGNNAGAKSVNAVSP